MLPFPSTLDNLQSSLDPIQIMTMGAEQEKSENARLVRSVSFFACHFAYALRLRADAH